MDESSAVAVLVENQLIILHARSGVKLFTESDFGREQHATLAAALGRAVVWKSNRRSIQVHGLVRDRGILEDETLPDQQLLGDAA